ncbi:MAG: hypothetical protein KGK18_02825, partial [Burkholderiales bacterium]|nr:hypothetical protein [Burkholderiales bacterium]
MTDRLPTDTAAAPTRPSEPRSTGFGTTMFDALAPAEPAPAMATFDVCHVGVVLRALLFVHAVLAIGVLFAAGTFAGWLASFATGSSVALPAVLL